ncbi:glycosyltransferase family 4 protein [Actinotalea ferrariae]|uniref:glycosyltransferase family 4 protein n=1 Tax=Actinotalea ferrariae TaxID=1386098 RepID=UPI001C8B34A3|nr:glycosyltransferase family 4 protein [Actinotalea ferrariae]MBX9247102.1 glycosyltransferase family 4 protein [Actinotalea ferrariae]
MRVLVWHVHGSWMTSFVQGAEEYLVPVVPNRGPEGRGRARTWDWPSSVVEVTPEQLRETPFDVVVLQRPEELELLERWTGLRAGIDVPAVYVEHNTPAGHAVATRHPLADRTDITIAHVTAFNALVWDCGDAPTTLVDHGIVDPGLRYTGERERVGVVVNEPVRRWRVAGTDQLLRMAQHVGVDVYGMGMAALEEAARTWRGDTAPDLTLHDDVPQGAMHDLLARDRAYFHPYRWTSLGLSLLEAMALGLPVLAFATTAAPEAVPPSAGLVSNDPDALAARARRWLHDPDEARETGLAARAHVLSHFGLDRFLADWHRLLKEVAR